MYEAAVPDRDFVAIAGAAGGPAHGVGDTAAAADTEAAGKSAGAAATADRLRENADRVGPRGQHLAAIFDGYHRRRAAAAPRSGADRRLRVAAGAKRTADGKGTVAAATADRLGFDAVG